MAPASTSEFADLVAAFWDYYGLSASKARADRLLAESTQQTAIEEVRRVSSDVDLVVPLLVALAAEAPSDQALCYLGASVIEEVVHSGQPSDVLLDRIEGAARRDERFRIALGCVAWHDEALRTRFGKLT